MYNMTRAEAIEIARTLFDPYEEEYMAVEYTKDGYDGPGWYCWDTEYTDEGSTFLGE